MHPWLATLHTALRQEEAAQRARHEATVALPLRDRVIAGITWHPVRLEVDDREVVVRPARGASLSDEIQAGDRVTLDPPGAPGSGPPARVIGVDPEVAVLRLARGEIAPESAAITLSFDGATFVRQRQALERADAAPGKLRDLLLAARLPDDPLPPPPAAQLAIFTQLQQAQRDAAITALRAPRLAAIHGPPGTGKTYTLVALLRALVLGGDRPWALADSNAAVDHLAEQAAAAGLHVVRLGPRHRMNGAVAALSLEARLADGPHASALSTAERAISRARARRASSAELRQLYQVRDGIAAQARADALLGAEVIATTLGTLARVAAELPPAHTAVVDEASQAIEPAIWAAVPHIQRLVLVGDPHQLGPVVIGPPAPLSRSLLDRLLHEQRVPMPMLQVQRRMSSEIASLVRAIYGDAYQPHPSVAAHRLHELPGVIETAWTTPALSVIDTSGAGEGEQRDPLTGSLFNPLEVAVARHVVAALREAGVSPNQIGVATPYRAQRARLRESHGLTDVYVDTINAFQGREREVIVLSLVRANDEGTLGFVDDDRRLTVALSRARRSLFIIGDLSTLSHNRRLAELAADADANGVLRSVWELEGIL